MRRSSNQPLLTNTPALVKLGVTLCQSERPVTVNYIYSKETLNLKCQFLIIAFNITKTVAIR